MKTFIMVRNASIACIAFHNTRKMSRVPQTQCIDYSVLNTAQNDAAERQESNSKEQPKFDAERSSAKGYHCSLPPKKNAISHTSVPSSFVSLNKILSVSCRQRAPCTSRLTLNRLRAIDRPDLLPSGHLLVDLASQLLQ